MQYLKLKGAHFEYFNVADYCNALNNKDNDEIKKHVCSGDDVHKVSLLINGKKSELYINLDKDYVKIIYDDDTYYFHVNQWTTIRW